jgi:hypothetical protein
MTEQSATTGTLVLDLPTMAKALTCLSQTIGSDQWVPVSDPTKGRQQQLFLEWCHQHRSRVDALDDLQTAVSTSSHVLNSFLVKSGFEPAFREITQGGVGVVAILDMLVRWAVEASITTITRYEYTPNYREFHHRAFEIPKDGAQFFSVPDQRRPLVRLATREGGAVWLMMADRPVDGLDLAKTATFAMATRKPADDTWWSAVQVPTLEIDTKVQLDWILGLSADSHIIDQAFQLLKLRMNEKGARVKVATGFATTRGGSRTPMPLEYDRPFIGWFTQDGSTLPIAAFYADYDSWTEPGGNLEDL